MRNQMSKEDSKYLEKIKKEFPGVPAEIVTVGAKFGAEGAIGALSVYVETIKSEQMKMREEIFSKLNEINKRLDHIVNQNDLID